MTLYNLNRDLPWFFQYMENYYHLLLDVRFGLKKLSKNEIPFSMELGFQGFEGLIFFLYKPFRKKIIFDLFKHSVEQVHRIDNLIFNLEENQTNSIDFVIIPFGYFRDEHKITLFIKSDKIESGFELYSWTPSNLYKNVKSIIKVGNRYTELIPIADYKGYYFQADGSFKGNETGRLFDLINLLVELEKTIDEFTNETIVDPMDDQIKQLVGKTNEFLFELCQKTVPLDIKNLIRELERLKFNVDNLSKEEIFNWLDDLIDFYSERRQYVK